MFEYNFKLGDYSDPVRLSYEVYVYTIYIVNMLTLHMEKYRAPQPKEPAK